MTANGILREFQETIQICMITGCFNAFKLVLKHETCILRLFTVFLLKASVCLSSFDALKFILKINDALFQALPCKSTKVYHKLIFKIIGKIIHMLSHIYSGNFCEVYTQFFEINKEYPLSACIKHNFWKESNIFIYLLFLLHVVWLTFMLKDMNPLYLSLEK